MAAILFMFIIFPCHCAVYMYKIMILQKPISQLPPNFTLILLLKCDWVCSNDHAPLTVMPYIIFFFKIKNCSNDDLFISCSDRIGKMMHNICIISGERPVARGPLVWLLITLQPLIKTFHIWYGGTWEGSLPFYIYGPLGHAPGRG